MLQFVVLATAWTLFSGPTRYISLATAAFFGIGAYTMAVLSDALPLPAVIAVAALVGVAVALVVGLSTLRLRGIFFVIFTFGLAELIRQVVAWYEIKVSHTVGRYIFLDIGQEQIFWELSGARRPGLPRRLADRPLAPRPGAQRHRQRRDRRPPCRHQHHRRQAGAVRRQRRLHERHRRDHGAALHLYRPGARLQSDALLPGGHHGAARRHRAPLRAALRRGAAGPSCWRRSPSISPTTSTSCSASSSSSSSISCPTASSAWPTVGGGGPAGAGAASCGRAPAGHDQGRAARDRPAHQDLRRPHRGQQSHHERRRGRDRRPDRAERLRQDDGAQPDLRRVEARRRRDPLARARYFQPAGQPDRPPRHRPHLPARARAGIPELPRQRHRRPRLPPQSTVGAGGEEARRGAARSRRAGKPGRCPRRAADLYRPETAGTRPRAGARPAGPAARRVAGGLNPRELGIGVALSGRCARRA